MSQIFVIISIILVKLEMFSLSKKVGMTYNLEWGYHSNLISIIFGTTMHVTS